jgi:hypothetical protein
VWPGDGTGGMRSTLSSLVANRPIPGWCRGCAWAAAMLHTGRSQVGAVVVSVVVSVVVGICSGIWAQAAAATGGGGTAEAVRA